MVIQSLLRQLGCLPGLVNVNQKRWKITMLLMGKSTISITIFNVANSLFTRGYLLFGLIIVDDSSLSLTGHASHSFRLIITSQFVDLRLEVGTSKSGPAACCNGGRLWLGVYGLTWPQSVTTVDCVEKPGHIRDSGIKVLKSNSESRSTCAIKGGKVKEPSALDFTSTTALPSAKIAKKTREKSRLGWC